MTEPKTLQEAILYFGNQNNCLAYLANKRWPDGVVICPTCGGNQVHFLHSRGLWQCVNKHTRRQFSIKVGTVMEDSPIGLDKWLCAMWMLTNDKNGISSYEIHRGLGITQKSAWFLMHRIRLAMQENGTIFRKLTGHVEVDETFIGGKARNMHKAKRKAKIQGRGATGKVVVMGLMERGGHVRAQVIPERDKPTVQGVVREHVSEGSSVYTDELVAYLGLDDKYSHEIINHAEEYVRGLVHTNGMENFWSLLKRGLHGTYVSVEPFHLFRYIDEQSFRFNHRATPKHPMTDADRFRLVTSQIAGKRLTYKELTGKEMEKPRPEIPF
ncbi:MAG TPA: IS1595 family transposase [Candidatus Angelobacter sp.]|nr:IS1595 family transposase [Candidatus Angelobacter sp.]